MSPSCELRDDVCAFVKDSNLKEAPFILTASDPLNIILLAEVKVGVPTPLSTLYSVAVTEPVTTSEPDIMAEPVYGKLSPVGMLVNADPSPVK